MKNLLLIVLGFIGLVGVTSAMPAYNYNNTNTNYNNYSDQSICGMRNGYFDTTDNSCTIGRIKQCNNGVCTVTTRGTTIDLGYWRNYYNQNNTTSYTNTNYYQSEQNRIARLEQDRINEQIRRDNDTRRINEQNRLNENNRIATDCTSKGGYIQDSSATWYVCVVPTRPLYNNYNDSYYNNSTATKKCDDDFTTTQWSQFLREHYGTPAQQVYTAPVKKTYTKKYKRNYR